MKVYSEITPSDIVQGFCGDCYFLSSISSLAEFPDRLKDIFITKDINGEHEIWALLLEKAWAKIYGSYMRIEGG